MKMEMFELALIEIRKFGTCYAVPLELEGQHS